MSISISVIIPSLGRPTLGRAIKSCAGADEVLVEQNSDNDHGYAARTRLQAQATGTHLVYLDDDDVFAPGAIGAFREAATAKPEKIHLFKMRYFHGGATLWQTQDLRFGQVGTPCFLVPNVPEKLGVWKPWGDRNATCGGDYNFIHGCVQKMGEPEWVDRVVAILRPA